MVNARGQDMQAGRFPDVLADRRRALQSNKEATTKTATDLLQRIDGKKEDGIVRHEKRRPERAHLPMYSRATCPLARQGRIPSLSAPVDRLDMPWNTCVAMK
jgi:hypothetical protein